jgi:hypothetical protein
MIQIAGSCHRSFIFPAGLPTAYAFYNDLSTVLGWLDHISIVKRYSDSQFRMLYCSTELGLYHVNLYCDLRTQLDQNRKAIYIRPFKQLQEVKKESAANSLFATGSFSSASLFYEEGNQTRIEYSLQLSASMPVPFGLRLMPKRVMNGIANSITEYRIYEIAEGFIQHSISAYYTTAKLSGNLHPRNLSTDMVITSDNPFISR